MRDFDQGYASTCGKIGDPTMVGGTDSAFQLPCRCITQVKSKYTDSATGSMAIDLTQILYDSAF